MPHIKGKKTRRCVAGALKAGISVIKYSQYSVIQPTTIS